MARRSLSTSAGTLYVARDQDVRSLAWGAYVKIGLVRGDRSTIARTKEHQTGNPRAIVPLHYIQSEMVHQLETQMHHEFAPHWVKGEWFALSDAAVAAELLPAAHRHAAEQADIASALARQEERKTRASSGCVRSPSAEESALYRDAVVAREALLVALARKSFATVELRALHRRRSAEESSASSGIDGVLRLATKRSAARLDWPRLRAAHPAVAALCDVRHASPLVRPGSVQIAGARTLRQLDPDLAAQLQTRLALLAAFVPLTPDAAEMPLLPRCEEARALHADFVDALPDAQRAEWNWKKARSRLLDALGEDDGIEGCVVWRRVCAAAGDGAAASPAQRAAALARERPDLVDEFTKPAAMSVSVDVSFSRPYCLD